MQAPVHHITGLTSIVRERLLPISGKVLVRLNQKVSPNDVIAEANLAREHVLLDVARILGVTSNMADRLIKCKVDDRLAASAVIAVGKGLFPRSVAAPREGRVVVVGGGQVLMEVGETKTELRAGIAGTVAEIIPNRGAMIQTAGALVQGVWGNGRIDSGLYPSLIPMARDMRYPIIVTDGFGPLPMNSAAYKLLSTSVKLEATVNAEAYDRYSGARPEVIIPRPISAPPATPHEVETFAPGLQVRMRRPPALGMIGTIVAVKPGLTTLLSGLRAPAAEVKLENGETVVAPLVNLEVVG